MAVLYLIAVWVHILTVVVWIGAMLFEDPQSVRMTSRIADRMGGVGWYAQAILWTTGLFMLNYRGISPASLFTRELISTPWGRALWAKLTLVLVLVGFQIAVGHKPSKLVYGYLAVSVLIVAISVYIVRPFIF
jgi:putative copper export protein